MPWNPRIRAFLPNLFRLFLYSFLGLCLVVTVFPLGVIKPRRKNLSVQCYSNLKQVGYAFSDFLESHGLRFPMDVEVGKGGSKEMCESPDSTYLGALKTFSCMSEQLKNPKVLKCPSSPGEAAKVWKEINQTNVTYFVDLHADIRRPQSILTGDSHIVADGQRIGLLTTFTTNATYVYTKELHGGEGVMLQVDGSVQYLNVKKLTPFIHSSLD